MTDIFTASDFNIDTETGVYKGNISPEKAAAMANIKFKEWLEHEGEIVYGWYERGKNSEIFGRLIRPAIASHKAILVCIEELKKKECDHKPKIHDDGFLLTFEPVCEFCEEPLRYTGWVAE